MSDRPRWDDEGRDWPHREASRFVAAGGIEWHVQTMGSGPVALLVHGTGSATHTWRDLAPLLAEHFTVVAPDLPGHGFTTGRPAGGLALPAMARAVGALVSTLDVKPRLIVGHSAGAAIALRVTLDGLATPDAIVGLNPALLPFPGLAAQLFPALARLLFVNPFAPLFFSRLARTPGEVARFLPRSTGSRIDARGVELYRRLFATSAQCAGAMGMMAAWDLDAFARDLPRIHTPVLLVDSDRDAAIPAGNAVEAAKRIASARVTTLSGPGHLMHEERPAAVAELIVGFARECGVLGEER